MTPKTLMYNVESTTLYIEASCKTMAAKYSSLVDLVKNLGYIQSCIDAQIDVKTMFYFSLHRRMP